MTTPPPGAPGGEIRCSTTGVTTTAKARPSWPGPLRHAMVLECRFIRTRSPGHPSPASVVTRSIAILRRVRSHTGGSVSAMWPTSGVSAARPSRSRITAGSATAGASVRGPFPPRRSPRSSTSRISRLCLLRARPLRAAQSRRPPGAAAAAHRLVPRPRAPRPRRRPPLGRRPTTTVVAVAVEEEEGRVPPVVRHHVHKERLSVTRSPLPTATVPTPRTPR